MVTVQIFDMNAADGKEIARFDSRGARHRPLAWTAGGGGVGVIRIAPGGVIGRHAAVVPQLFCVIEGAGWVSGDDGAPVEIRAGQAVLWLAGEEHESGSRAGLTALVVESTEIDTS